MASHGVVDDQLSREIERFLIHEARLLDNRQYKEWLDLKTDDIICRIPVRVTKYKNSGSEFHYSMNHVDDNRHLLEMRLKKYETDSDYAEDPPSRTRHFISNIEVTPGEKENEVNANSYMLLYRSRGNSVNYELLSGERRDVLRNENGVWKVARRTILLDQTILSFNNLAILF